jgi:hypothetical protein
MRFYRKMYNNKERQFLARLGVHTHGLDAIPDGNIYGRTVGDMLNDGRIDLGKAVDDAGNDTGIFLGYLNGLKLEDASLTAQKYGAGSIGSDPLANGAVTEGKIGALAVTEGKLGNLAVSSGKIAANAVVEDKINAGAVTENKIGAAAVTSGKLGAAAVGSAALAANAVTAPAVADGAIAAVHVAGGWNSNYATANATFSQRTRG